MKAEDVLDKYGRAWFSDDVEMIDKTSHVEYPAVLLAMEEYAKLKWIAISEQTPPDYENVIYYDNRDKGIHISYFVWSQTPVIYMTHWMPLPKPPNA